MLETLSRPHSRQLIENELSESTAKFDPDFDTKAYAKLYAEQLFTPDLRNSICPWFRVTLQHRNKSRCITSMCKQRSDGLQIHLRGFRIEFTLTRHLARLCFRKACRQEQSFQPYVSRVYGVSIIYNNRTVTPSKGWTYSFRQTSPRTRLHSNCSECAHLFRPTTLTRIFTLNFVWKQ